MLCLTVYRASALQIFLFDPRHSECDESAVLQLALSRSFCLRADLILVGPLSTGCPLRVFHPDGTPLSEICPLAIRVFAHHLRQSASTVPHIDPHIPDCLPCSSDSIECLGSYSPEEIRTALSLSP